MPSQTWDPPVVDCFPDRIAIEGIPVDAFPSQQSFLQRLVYEAQKPEQSVIYYLNIHGANLAYQNPLYKDVLQSADLVFCDGAGIVLASSWLGSPIPIRLPVMDWFYDMLDALAKAGLSVFFLAGEPGIAEKALTAIELRLPHHSIIGVHHGYILANQEIEQHVIDQINHLQPDIVFVGLGMPLQEFWIDEHRHRLHTGALCAIGAALDYVADKVSRCPRWMGEVGIEWIFRLGLEPKRMFGRYVVGNPEFLGRILTQLF